MNVELEGTELQVSEPIALPSAPEAPVHTEPSDESAEQRYLRRIGVIVNDAGERGELSDLVGVMTWALASIASNCGRFVAGDILRRLGQGLCVIAEREQAEKEAEEAKRGGARAH